MADDRKAQEEAAARKARDEAKRVARATENASREVDATLLRYLEARKTAEAACASLRRAAREMELLEKSLSRQPVLRYSGLALLLRLRRVSRAAMVAAGAVSAEVSPVDAGKAREASLARAVLSIQADSGGFE